MTDSEQKILDAALKIFARKGYDAATTRAIAEESGYTEMTLFRKFQTKKNLFDQVLTRGNDNLQRSSPDLFIQKESMNTREFIINLINNLDKFILDNFEFFHLSVIENSKTVDPILELTVDDVGSYLKKNMPDQEINYKTFAFAISSYIYILNIDRYYERTATFEDYEKSKSKMVDILDCMLEN
ncbi:MAG: TetR/AcrR family transcriptional regulator [Methanobacterium sp.]|nr:TetR/AcrR family transcriptional regulator [Methanobacterium sp.]